MSAVAGAGADGEDRTGGTTEVCFLLDSDGRVLWRDVSADPHALPDSRARWLAIWERRDVLAEIAHSHPHGPLAFSAQDTSTMAAIDAALGRRLTYTVVTADNTLRRPPDGRMMVPAPDPEWAGQLRVASGMVAWIGGRTDGQPDEVPEK